MYAIGALLMVFMPLAGILKEPFQALWGALYALAHLIWSSRHWQ
jgi:hypothetical protein